MQARELGLQLRERRLRGYPAEPLMRGADIQITLEQRTQAAADLFELVRQQIGPGRACALDLQNSGAHRDQPRTILWPESAHRALATDAFATRICSTPERAQTRTGD